MFGEGRGQRANSKFSPESTEDSQGDQEHHQGGAVAHGVHDLQLQQVGVLEKETHVNPTCPPDGQALSSDSMSPLQATWTSLPTAQP